MTPIRPDAQHRSELVLLGVGEQSNIAASGAQVGFGAVEGTASVNGLALTVPDALLEAVAVRAAALVLDRIREREAIDADRWLSTRDAAEYAGCTVNALHKAMAARMVRFEQDVPGGKAWFKRSDIDRWRRGDA